MKIVIYPSNSSDLHHTGYTVLHIGSHQSRSTSAACPLPRLILIPFLRHHPHCTSRLWEARFVEYRLRYLPIQGRSLSAYPRKQNAVLSIHPALSSGPLVSIPGLLLITRTLRKRRCKTSWSSSTSPALLVVGLEIQD
jgi:hypothetical protein